MMPCASGSSQTYAPVSASSFLYNSCGSNLSMASYFEWPKISFSGTGDLQTWIAFPTTNVCASHCAAVFSRKLKIARRIYYAEISISETSGTSTLSPSVLTDSVTVIFATYWVAILLFPKQEPCTKKQTQKWAKHVRMCSIFLTSPRTSAMFFISSDPEASYSVFPWYWSLRTL